VRVIVCCYKKLNKAIRGTEGMNRIDYFNYIESKLSYLVTRIEIRGATNILDLHLHSEDFYKHLFNALFNWQLENLNGVAQNVPGVDLADSVKKIVIQVSSTATKEKVESALTRDLSAYKGHSFKFISISKSIGKLRSAKFTNPHGLLFDPATDMYDVPKILNIVKELEVEKLHTVYELVRSEFGAVADSLQLETNLAHVIGVLAKESFSAGSGGVEVNEFEIDRKIDFNDLNAARDYVDDYKLHYSRLDRIYTEFDRLGVNKSQSVLGAIRSEYIKNKAEKSGDTLFFVVLDAIENRILTSSNFVLIPREELEQCVAILVVDAFIRCKIFMNPSGYEHVTS